MSTSGTTTSATTTSALMAFPRYLELPPELRLTIIEETLDSVSSIDRRSLAKGKFAMGPYACVDREWNRVVELRLFKDITVCPQRYSHSWTMTNSTIHQELIDFGAVCGKRSGRLSRIVLRYYEFDQASFDNHPLLQLLFQLFDLMKDWDHKDREQQGLIALGLDFQFCVHSSSSPWMGGNPHYLGRFPQVPVIGSMREIGNKCPSVHLHPCTQAALCQKLPSVYRTSLTLPSGSSEYVSTGDFIRAMDSLRAHKPGLTHLDLRTCLERNLISGSITTPLPIMQRLSDSPSPWTDRLESLKIHHDIAVEEFLRNASKVVWPNLKVIKLVGPIDDERQDGGLPVGEDDENAVVDESSGRIVTAIITALPRMPKAINLQITMFFTESPHKEFKVSIHLGNIGKSKKTGKTPPCVDSFVPDSNSGVAKVSDAYLPGSITIQLQDVVRAQRCQELEVFTCGEDGWFYDSRKPHRPCAKWDRRTERWNAIFRNSMDIFIYEMGQYWERVDEMDNWW